MRDTQNEWDGQPFECPDSLFSLLFVWSLWALRRLNFSSSVLNRHIFHLRTNPIPIHLAAIMTEDQETPILGTRITLLELVSRNSTVPGKLAPHRSKSSTIRRLPYLQNSWLCQFLHLPRFCRLRCFTALVDLC